MIYWHDQKNELWKYKKKKKMVLATKVELYI